MQLTAGWYLVVAGTAFAMGCGGEPFSGAAPVDASAAVDATGIPGTDGSIDDGSTSPPSSVYPAVHASLPIVGNLGGPILDAPQIVTVTFAGDPLVSQLTAFGDAVASSQWWNTVRNGYCAVGGSPCVGPAAHTASAVLPAFSPDVAASGLDDSADDSSSMKQFIRAQITAGLLPAPTPNTVYLLFFPDGIAIRTFDAYQACTDFAGYHWSMQMVPPEDLDAGEDAGGDVEFTYAVLPRCQATLDELSRDASHELIESATDPLIDDNAYWLTDPVWPSFYGGNEVADLCIDEFTGNDTVVEDGWTYQRVWSNAAVRAGQDPCVPAVTSAPYFNTAPPTDELRLVPQVPVTIELDGFSEGPTSDWEVFPIDLYETDGLGQYLDLSVDSAGINNGTKRLLTLTLLRPAPPGSPVGAPLILRSSANGQSHYWPIAVIATQATPGGD